MNDLTYCSFCGRLAINDRYDNGEFRSVICPSCDAAQMPKLCRPFPWKVEIAGGGQPVIVDADGVPFLIANPRGHMDASTASMLLICSLCNDFAAHPVGNGASMRSVLVWLDSVLEDGPERCEVTRALMSRPRNCDMFSSADDAMRAFFESWQHADKPEFDDFVDWLFDIAIGASK